MGYDFEWDIQKAEANLKKHKVSFEEAITVFSDPLAITVPDPQHSLDELRFIDIGISYRGRLLVVVYTERDSAIRIIGCRRATRREQKTYEQNED
jgi:uncharacterized DUF497 family protein